MVEGRMISLNLEPSENARVASTARLLSCPEAAKLPESGRRCQTSRVRRYAKETEWHTTRLTK